VIGGLLESLEKLEYPDFEVIVCNDHSSDNTDEILNWFAGENDHFRWFLGDNLPGGWLGKNFACHQLAKKSNGKYLIFLDADVELSKDSISKAVDFFQQKRLSLLSIFPQQQKKTWTQQHLRLTPRMTYWYFSTSEMALCGHTICKLPFYI